MSSNSRAAANIRNGAAIQAKAPASNPSYDQATPSPGGGHRPRTKPKPVTPPSSPVKPTPAAAAPVKPAQKNPTGPGPAPAAPPVALRYPNTAWPEKQDFIQFDAYQYAKTDFKIGDAGAGDLSFKAREFGTSKGTVILPIQARIGDQNTVNWTGQEMNPLQMAAAQASLTVTRGGDVGEALKKSADNVKGLFQDGDFKRAMDLYFAGKAASAQGLLSRLEGTIANPNLELLFQGPELRSFQFTFIMSARDEPEATVIRQIIRFFKENMAVQRTKTNIFLKSPNIFEIKYKTGAKDHPSINRIKKCALQNFSVDYTPAGTYSTYNDPKKTMTMYSMTLSFMELEPVFSDQYSDIPRDEIGF
jgi:hypothetical protein